MRPEQELHARPDGVGVHRVQVVGAVVVVLEAQARELRRMEDQERRDALAVAAEGIVVAAVVRPHRLAAAAAVLVAQPGVIAAIVAYLPAIRKDRQYAVPCLIASGLLDQNGVFAARRVIHAAAATANFRKKLI